MSASFVDNAMVFLVGKLGLNLKGAEVLTVVGRKSGVPRSIVVNPLEFEGGQYLLSARGESNWVRNARASGTVGLKRGKRSGQWQITEIHDEAEKIEIMWAYLQQWGWQVKSFMHLDASSTRDQIAARIGEFPIFRLSAV